METEEQDEEMKRMLEIESIYDQDLAKLNRLRQVLAKKNQEIARIVRQIDDIPTRAELIQYERRFVELYELVAEKLVETRKYYAMYNTLEETHRYMSHEVSLLESVNENFPQSMKSKAGMTHFLESFGQIVDGLSQNLGSEKSSLELEVVDREKYVFVFVVFDFVVASPSLLRSQITSICFNLTKPSTTSSPFLF